MNNPLDTKGIPKEGGKDTACPRSRATSKGDQKKDLDNPQELAIVIGRTLPANGVQPTFLSSHILGASNLTVAKQSTRTHNENNKKAITIPGRERMDNQCFFLLI